MHTVNYLFKRFEALNIVAENSFCLQERTKAMQVSGNFIELQVTDVYCMSFRSPIDLL